MTDKANVPEPVDGQSIEQTDQSRESGARPNEEAKRYRLRLRDTEAERDRLAERLTTTQRREVEQLATSDMADPTDLWQLNDLAAMLDEAGDVDASKVQAAVAELLAAKPHYRNQRRTPAPDPSQGPAQDQQTQRRLGAIFTRRD